MSNLNPNQFQDPLFEILSPGDRQAQAVRGLTAPPPKRLGKDERGFYRKEYPAIRIGRDDVQYEYKIPNPADEYEAAHLSAEVFHTRNSADYDYEPVEGTDRQIDHRLWSHSWLSPAKRDAMESHLAGTPKLFGSHEVSGRSEVHSMFGTREGRAHVGTLLGIAARDTAIKYGRTLSAPEDLSPYSARLVRGLKGRGALDEGVSDTVLNNYGFHDEPQFSSSGPGERIPDDEVRAGRSTMRSVLRQGRPRKPRETYTQERLL